MSIDNFRLLHSTIMEHYQFIEFHLEGLYAKICGKDFALGLDDVKKSNLYRLIQEIKKIEKENQRLLFSDIEYNRLEKICVRRNFWCHNCYVELVFDRKTGDLKKKEDMMTLIEDLKEAELVRNSLFEKIDYLYRNN